MQEDLLAGQDNSELYERFQQSGRHCTAWQDFKPIFKIEGCQVNRKIN
jgi:hypothetical protein